MTKLYCVIHMNQEINNEENLSPRYRPSSLRKGKTRGGIATNT